LGFVDLYLDSGWLLTSLTNFLNELAGCLSSFFSNPEHILARGPGGKFRLTEWQPGARGEPRRCGFNFMFKPLPDFVFEGEAPKQVYYNPRHEGDDGIGMIDRRMVSEANIAVFESHQCDLGFQAKFKAIIDGRAEYIGAHMVVVDGRLDVNLPWCPALERYVAKTGVHAQARGDLTEAQRAACAAARFLSLSKMFEGRIESMCGVFDRLGRAWASKAPGSTLVRTSSSYDALAEITGVTGTKTLQEWRALIDRANEDPVVYPTGAVQNLMLLNSLQKPNDTAIVGKLDLWAQDVAVRFEAGDIDHLASWSCLPVEIRGGPVLLGPAAPVMAPPAPPPALPGVAPPAPPPAHEA
jgi:hypothetical protein